MAQTETVVALIQVIAFFLPAWAIMIQILARMMERVDLDENPYLIPLFGIGLTLSVVSFYMFDLATMDAILHLVSQELEQDPSPTFVGAFSDLVMGSSAFILLGIIVLAVATTIFFSRENRVHVVFIAILSYAIMNWGSKIGSPVAIARGLIFLVALDLLFIRHYWETVKPKLSS
ncbi:hypothetical protein ACFQJC_17330 [Haloferax namakaokahaiae]|uniref:Uncharacterized protein n=1 Tax=Haloferax namakaokahaiae TaxID=1748331 RepID=A0ABD5ZIY4_9EURY